MPETATASERYHLFIPTKISARNIVFEISLKAASLSKACRSALVIQLQFDSRVTHYVQNIKI